MNKELEISKKALKNAKALVLESKNSILQNRDSVQTGVDIISQDSIIKAFKENDISCRLYSEELEGPLLMLGGQYEIVLDPIDGSFMFLHGIRAFTSIAMTVLENRNVKYAFVQSIAQNDLYHCDATDAFLNGEKIACQTDNAKEPYLITGFTAKKRLLGQISALEKLSVDFYFSSDGGPLLSAMVASNNIDSAIEFFPAPFHELAGALIAQKAGAFVETIDGSPILIDPLVKQTLITSRSEKLLRNLQRVLQ